ncbi:MAG TPA: hypothetical protein VGS07_18660 [Thermoanaerobaculia bacterium]|jgi:hypothetical protein|nr:hypothetical protein [Thermoanaerobaculia bacterium]
MPLENLGVLTLTHSSRTTNLARCSVQFLTRRFGNPERLRDLPPFASLPPAEVLYSGAVSFHRILGEGGRIRLESLGHVRSRDRIQDVAVLGPDDLLIGFENRLERWRLRAPIDRLKRVTAGEIEIVGRFEHPHLVGLHTLEPLGDDRVALSCSASDSVLIFDLNEGRVERTMRLPSSLYGQGYELGESDDLRRHAIPDEGQTTHVNAAHRAGGSCLVVSTLIQGAIGCFDLASGGYEEICRGFVGCHGARQSAEGEIYFADSPGGRLVFLNPEGWIARSFATGSHWLHDVQQIAGSIYAFALADSNELRIYDVASGELLWRRSFLVWPLPGMFGAARLLPGWLGNSVQALGFHRVCPLITPALFSHRPSPDREKRERFA